MAQIVEDIVNQALQEIGYPERVVNIYQGGPAAEAALEFYGQSRDEALAASFWYFAKGEVTLASAGVSPPFNWSYEFIYPAGAIRLLQLMPSTVVANDPMPLRWLEIIDTRLSSPQRAIVTNGSVTTAIITTQVTDPAAFPPEFTALVVQILAKKLSTKLAAKETKNARG